MSNMIIKQCTGCQIRLPLDEIISSPEIKPIGITFSKDRPDSAYFLFEHDSDRCGVTFTIDVNDFLPFITEEIPLEKLIRTRGCSHYCADLDDINDCHDKCYYAPFRRLLFRMMGAKNKFQYFQSV